MTLTSIQQPNQDRQEVEQQQRRRQRPHQPCQYHRLLRRERKRCRSQPKILLPLFVVILVSSSLILGIAAFAVELPSSIFRTRQKSGQSSTIQRHNSLLKMSSSTEVEEKDEIKVLGVCGGIGSGKSSASKLLVSELGCLEHLGELQVDASVDSFAV